MDEAVEPDVVRPLGAETYTGVVVLPQTPPLRLFGGTFNPSRRHRRSTRLSLTCQPASRSKPAIRR